MTEAQKKNLESIIKIIFNYFKEVFSFWFKDEMDDVEDILGEFENV